ncbi:hypothetical protein [Streptomyces misionensis]|uniref:hypothetical protein n=1 Tax=Streptomyces misionensis TaxID=67331 RepID=UPI0033AF6795
MTANPPTAPEQATVGSAVALKQQLEDALREAAFTSSVESADDGTALKLTVYSSSYCPFEDTVDAASDWLRAVGIDATAALDESTFRIVLTLPTADSVRTLIATLLQPWITAHTTAKHLDDVLSDHGLDAKSTWERRPSASTWPRTSWTRPSPSRGSSAPRTSEKISSSTAGAGFAGSPSGSCG